MDGGDAHFIGRLDGREHGPLVVLVGGVHGNEPAGVIAVERCMRQLSAPGLERGRVLGLLGNPGAYRLGRRGVHEDINRVFERERLAEIAAAPTLNNEEACAKTLLAAIDSEIAAYAPTELVLLDLHTTSADGGDFVILGDGPDTEPFTRDFGVPVVLGLTSVLPGTLCGYLSTAVAGVPTRTFAYEAGAHDGPESPDRAYALIAELLTRLGLASDKALGQWTPLPLATPARPALTRVRFRLGIPPGGQFVMMPGFRNFDPVQAGQVVAVLDGESVALECGGYMLMPLYQGEGRDGFFVVD